MPATFSDRRGWRKHCSCGHAYTRREFFALEHVGIHDEGPELIDLRNCKVCGSTIAVALGPSTAAKRVIESGGA